MHTRPLAAVLALLALAVPALAQNPRPPAQLLPTPLPLSLNLGGGQVNNRQGAAGPDLFAAVQNGVNVLANGRGVANGLATLDGAGFVPITQIPAIPTTFPQAVLLNRTGPVSGSNGGISLQSSATTAEQIFRPQYPGADCAVAAPSCPYFTVDGIRATMEIPAGSTAINTQAFGGYVANRSTANGVGQAFEYGNGVVYWGTILGAVPGSASWTGNTTYVDDVANGAALLADTAPRRGIGWEYDFSVRHPSTIIQGVSLNGSSSAQPAAADGFSCGSLGGPALWTHCFVVGEGTSLTGLYLGALGKSGPNRQSTPITLNWYDSASVGHLIDLFAGFGGVYARPSQGGSGVVLGTTTDGSAPFVASNSSTATDPDLELRTQGAGRIVARSRVIGTNGVNPGGVAFASLPPSLGPNDAGLQYLCVNCREPSQPVGQGSGVIVVWNGASWRSVAGGAAAN